MSLDTVTPKDMLISSYDCLSQILIATAGFESDPVQLAPVHALLSVLKTRFEAFRLGRSSLN